MKTDPVEYLSGRLDHAHEAALRSQCDANGINYKMVPVRRLHAKNLTTGQYELLIMTETHGPEALKR